MPTYEYRCDHCGHDFEKFQSINAGAVRKCPECGKLKVRRLISTGGGVIFKGSGFYETDYRKSSYTKDADKDKNKGKDKSGGDSGGSKKESQTKTTTGDKTDTSGKSSSVDKKSE